MAKPAHADEAPTREYIVDDRLPPASTRWKVIVGGLGATAAFYGAAQPFSYAWPESPGSMYLRYPVVGPWMSFAHNGCAQDDSCNTIWLIARGVLEALDGLGQAGGLAIAVEGIFMPTASDLPSGPGSPKKPQRKSPGTTPELPGSHPGNLFFIPRPIVVGQSGVGLGISGLF